MLIDDWSQMLHSHINTLKYKGVPQALKDKMPVRIVPMQLQCVWMQKSTGIIEFSDALSDCFHFFE